MLEELSNLSYLDKFGHLVNLAKFVDLDILVLQN
jgi:hypothetical protein